MYVSNDVVHVVTDTDNSEWATKFVLPIEDRMAKSVAIARTFQGEEIATVVVPYKAMKAFAAQVARNMAISQVKASSDDDVLSGRKP